MTSVSKNYLMKLLHRLSRWQSKGGPSSGYKQTQAQRSGNKAEDQACDYLRAQGLRIVERNFRCKWGEIDIIAQDQNVLAFVEVKQRSSNDFGGAAYAIPVQKQRKVIKTALYYMKDKATRIHSRFDVVLVDYHGITWIPHAYDGSSYE